MGSLIMDLDNDSSYLKDASLDLDRTLLSLQSDVSDTMFNMSDALSALPSEFLIINPEIDAQVSKRKSDESPYAHTTPLTIELKAPTSPATLLSEDSLTYLNQDQPYAIEISDAYGEEKILIRSVVRICFHQERMQIMEAQHLAFWQAHHQGERLLDLDLEGCFNCQKAYPDPDNLNAIVCIWHSSTPCSISVKAHCVSTEFTAKKHGGEKGVPFRIQVDSFREYGASHIYSAACQVKVFKPKGADRKNRTDREKIYKRSSSDKQLYRSPTPTTFLEEVSYCPMSRLAIKDSVPSTTTKCSVLAALDDFLSSGSQQHQTPLQQRKPTALSTATTTTRLAPSLLQCKRSAQDDESLDEGLREISLVGGNGVRQATASVPLHPPPVKNGRLFGEPTASENRNDPPASEVNVDALPLSQCEISEPSVSAPSRHFAPPLFCNPPNAVADVATPQDTFKQPLTLSVSSHKRSTTPGDAPCPGACSCCGRACFSYASIERSSDVSLEWSVKRQRRRRHTKMGVRHMV
uniref:CP2 domain-containing protein n=1 Tax=Mesocestoides corti TaxID=53468 RepID=A0A5K3FZD1_MESCO